MKKIILISLLAVSLFSCQKKVVESWRIVEIPVNASQWRDYKDADSLNLYWAVSVPVPELTKDIYLNGLVQCYRDLGNGTAVLPSVRHYQNGVAFWTQTIDYEYYTGGINFFVTNSDFENVPPEDMLFVLHLLEKH